MLELEKLTLWIGSRDANSPKRQVAGVAVAAGPRLLLNHLPRAMSFAMGSVLRPPLHRSRLVVVVVVVFQNKAPGCLANFLRPANVLRCERAILRKWKKFYILD